MNEQTALVPLADTMQLGKILAESGFFQDSRSASQAVVKVIAGRELGIGAVASMTGINIIQGRVALSANLIAALVKRSGRYNYRVIEHSDAVCKIAFYERLGDKFEQTGISIFTADDARKAGTKNMDKFPRNMLFARAMSNGAKWFCADIFGGPVYTPEELGAPVDESGEMIDVTPRRIEPEPARPEPMDDNSITDTDFAKLVSAQDERKAQAPQAPQSPQAQKQPRLARIIGNPGFPTYAAPFVKDFPHYANKQGVFDTEHILARVFQLGFAVIDVSNIAAVFAALREYATEQAALPKE